MRDKAASYCHNFSPSDSLQPTIDTMSTLMIASQGTAAQVLRRGGGRFPRSSTEQSLLSQYQMPTRCCQPQMLPRSQIRCLHACSFTSSRSRSAIQPTSLSTWGIRACNGIEATSARPIENRKSGKNNVKIRLEFFTKATNWRVELDCNPLLLRTGASIHPSPQQVIVARMPAIICTMYAFAKTVDSPAVFALVVILSIIVAPVALAVLVSRRI